MRRRALALLLAAAGACTRQSHDLVIANVHVVDVIGGEVLPNRTVTVDSGTITSVLADARRLNGRTLLDAQGGFLIPGLWDMHAHMESSGESWLQLYVANGVTGIRDMGSGLDLILGMREATAAGRIVGPRIFAAGPILDDAPGDWPFRIRVKTAEEGRAAVRKLKGRGVDLIKVHDHTPPAAYFAIAEEARAQGLPLAGHVPTGITFQQAIAAGQKDFEHLSNLMLWFPCSGGSEFRPAGCKPFFDSLATAGVWQTPTLGSWSELATIGTSASELSPDELAYAPQSMRDLWSMNQRLFVTPKVIRELREGARVGARVTNALSQAGVGILAGCDALIAGFCVHDEVALMVQGGMSPLAALQTATINPARYFGLEKTSGSLAPGQRADLVLLEGNPLEDISNVRRIRDVVLAGRLFDRRALDSLLAQVRAEAATSR